VSCERTTSAPSTIFTFPAVVPPFPSRVSRSSVSRSLLTALTPRLEQPWTVRSLIRMSLARSTVMPLPLELVITAPGAPTTVRLWTVTMARLE